MKATGRGASLRRSFEEADTWFRARALRERAILAAGAVALLVLVADAVAIRPVTSEIERTRLAIERGREEQARLRAEQAALQHVEPSVEDLHFSRERDLLDRQLAEVERQIATELDALVPPAAIVALLEKMLEADESMRLVRLRSQRPRRLGLEASRSADGGAVPSTEHLYRHGLSIEIEGGFEATLAYLRRIEASPWHLLWDRFEYRVEAFPVARIRIDLHTLSNEEEWIGV